MNSQTNTDKPAEGGLLAPRVMRGATATQILTELNAVASTFLLAFFDPNHRIKWNLS